MTAIMGGEKPPEVPFYAAAGVLYVGLFIMNPALQWSAQTAAAPAVVPVEFVAAVPVNVNLASGQIGGGQKLGLPGRLVGKRPHAVKPKPRVHHAPSPEAIKAAQDRAAARKAARKAAREERQRRIDQIAAEKRAEKQRIVEARAAKARQRLELSKTLATLSNPDEAVSDESSGSGSKSDITAALKDASAPSPTAGPSDTPGTGEDGAADMPGSGDGNGGSGSGVDVDGPLGNRRILHRIVPHSPEWIAQRGLDLTVILRFQVMADGTVKPGAMMIQKTSGFSEIDKLALDALRRWKFQAVPPASPSVWGRVTFHFTS